MVRKIRGPAPARSGGSPAPKNPNAMLGQLQQMQQQMAAAQEALGLETVEGSAGGGAVNVLMTGHQIVQSIKLNPEIVSADDVELLQDLVVAAVNDAVAKSRKLAEERLGPLTGGLEAMGLF
jgi:nucleoid-associated protein EbfC